MATAAHAVSNLDVAEADMMDLHSDNGLDFDDGDIELDIDPAPPQDEDVLISDVTDDAVHLQTVADDNDDFMIDHEDDYGEYNMQYDEEDGNQTTAASAQAQGGDQTTPTSAQAQDGDQTTAPSAQAQGGEQTTAASPQAPATQEQTYTPVAPIEEDLIDYSDEEEDDQTPVATAQAPSPRSWPGIGGYGDYDQDPAAGGYGDYDQEPAVSKYGGYDQDPAVGGYDDNDQEQHYGDGFEAGNQIDEQTDGEDGGVQLQDDVPAAATNDEQHDRPEEQHSIESRAITVNYEGNELWLFKQHDTEDSGDWLIEDISVIHSSLSDLFQACRASLGEDISNETELGLRFDHFHNMELFEDSTACVAVSLERLIGLYYTLHAQDGESDPESFYMCLLSRPRFATLLSDVAKYAEQGSGYAALNIAVAAGETHFTDALSGNSTEHEGTEWDNEEAAYNEEHLENGDSPGDAEHGVKLTEHEDQDATQSEGAEEANLQETTGTKITEDNHVSTPESVAQSKHESHSGDSATPHSHTEEFGQESTQRSVPDRSATQTPQRAKTEREEQLENDTVDFSDDDEEDNAPQTKATSAASPSSATVQGDNPTTGEASVHNTELTNPDELGHDDTTNSAHNDAFEELIQTQEQFEQNNNAESYEDYDETYDREEPFQEFQVAGQDAVSAEADFDGLTNQDYSGYDYQDLDQQLENDFISGADNDGVGAGESTNATTDFADGDDFLDLDNVPEWATDQEPASTVPDDTTLVHDEVTAQYEEEEDGVEQPAVAASSAADPVAASSIDLQDTSPQGQKRSIDEVGDSVGDALDLTDTKRPRM